MSVQTKSPKLSQFTRTSLCNYLPAVIKHNPSKNLGWHIEFYATSPTTKKLERYRYKINTIRKRYRLMSEFYTQASLIVTDINTRLATGWFPEMQYVPAGQSAVLAAAAMSAMPVVDNSWVEATNLNATTSVSATPQVAPAPVYNAAPETTPAPVESILSSYIEDNSVSVPATQPKLIPKVSPYIYNKEDGILLVDLIDRCIAAKKGAVRDDTLRSYNGFAKELKEFVNTYYPDILAKDFTKYHAQEYINRKVEAIQKKKEKAGDKYGVSERTINNQIKGMRQFFAWGIENDLVEDNPFQKLKLRTVREKRRTLVDEDALKKIKKHLTEKNQKGFLLVCMLVYGGFIRPKEIRHLKIENVRFKDHCIHVPANVSKNHCDRYVGITPEIEHLLLDMNIGSYPNDYYLVGSNMQPNSVIGMERQYRTAWAEMREELDLPDEMQLYSLKDTGITTMLEKGVAPIDVMKQAGHHDLSMTTRYANHADKRLAQKMYDNALSFGSSGDE